MHRLVKMALGFALGLNLLAANASAQWGYPRGYGGYGMSQWGADPAAGYMAGLTMARARNWKEFRAAMARYRVPSENLVYADTSGTIGWQLFGEAPRRRTGWGTLPLPGWANGAG